MKQSILTKNQKKVFQKVFTENGIKYRIDCKLRYDDQCNNGHNTFAITADIIELKQSGRHEFVAGGCCHEEIKKHFPELAHLIKWHLVSSDGPIHYIANAMYLAGNRDYNGLLKGEVDHRHNETRVKFQGFPITFKEPKPHFFEFIQANKGQLEIEKIEHKEASEYRTKFSFKGFCGEWYQCPFDTLIEAKEWLAAINSLPMTFIVTPTAWGNGKDRELEAARSVAIWPEATDEELTSPDLKSKLEARLPELFDRFSKDLEAIGFIF